MNENIINILQQNNNQMNEDVINELRKHNISENKINILKQIFIKNINVFETINISFIKSDYFESLNIDMLTYITTLEITQTELLNLSSQKKNLFLFMINKKAEKFYWPAYFSSLLKNLTDNMFDKLINDINLEQLSEYELQQLSCILTAKNNNLNITSLNDFKNYDSIIMENLNNSISNNNIENLKHYVLLQKFSLSLSEAKLLCQKYCYDLDKLSINNNFLIILKLIKQIVTENDINRILKLISNISQIPLEYPNYQTLAQNLYEEEYNSKLFNPNKHPYQLIDGVKVVDAGTEFCMISRADGAFTYYESNNKNINYYDMWNLPVRSTYSFSNSHISNSRLLMYALQSKKGLLTYGFANLPKNSIVENSLGDNATLHVRKKTIDPRAYNDNKKITPYTFDGCGQRFMVFDDIINRSSRQIHTEITLERFYYDANGEQQRLNPSYIVYNKINERYVEDELYKKSMKAAKDFNVPLVIIDLKRVLESERNKIIVLMEQPISIENVKSIIQIYSNNSIAGLSEENQSLINSYFPVDNNYVIKILDEILNKAKNQGISPQFYQDLFDYLMVLNIEKKIVSFGYLVRLKEKFALQENYSNYYEKIYGVTYLDYSNDEKSNCLYDYFQWKKIYELGQLYKIDITPDFYTMSAYRLNQNLKLCENKGIQPTKEILFSKNNKEFEECIRRNLKTKEILSEINSELLDKELHLPNGDKISAKKYIEEIVFPYMPLDESITLNSGAKIPLTHFIIECVIFDCQERYNGDFAKYIKENVQIEKNSISNENNRRSK